MFSEDYEKRVSGSWWKAEVSVLSPKFPHSPRAMAVAYAIIASVSAIAVMIAVDTRMAVAVTASAVVPVGYHRVYDAQILWLGIPSC